MQYDAVCESYAKYKPQFGGKVHVGGSLVTSLLVRLWCLSDQHQRTCADTPGRTQHHSSCVRYTASIHGCALARCFRYIYGNALS